MVPKIDSNVEINRYCRLLGKYSREHRIIYSQTAPIVNRLFFIFFQNIPNITSITLSHFQINRLTSSTSNHSQLNLCILFSTSRIQFYGNLNSIETNNNKEFAPINTYTTKKKTHNIWTMEDRLYNQHQRPNSFRLYDNHMNDHHHHRDNGNASGSNSDNSTDNDEVIHELWIFGYGSLCWYPGFEYSKCVTGYIRGYVRRFWQGNTTHRGNRDKPGRVATLIEENDGITWGCAYKIAGETALKYLKQRECTLGGYSTEYTKFYPRVAADDMELCGEAFPTLLYIATKENSLWLGDTPLPQIAQEIADSHGPSGHNVEYLLRLANFMRDELRGVVVNDEHLFELETLVRDILSKRNVCPNSLMGRQPERIRRDSHEEIRRPITFEFSSRVPDKKLRCLNI